MNKKLIPFLTLGVIAPLVACSTGNENSSSSNNSVLSNSTSFESENQSSTSEYAFSDIDFKILSPNGAPTGVFYPYFDNDKFESVDQPTLVSAQFLNPNKEYDVLVFDSLNGMNLIKNKGAKYKLARLLTKGNFFLMSLNGDNDSDAPISASSNILSFGEGGTPDKIFKKLYPELTEQIDYVSGVEMVYDLVLSNEHMYQGKQIDYVLLAEPYVSRIMENTTSKDYNPSLMNYKYNLQEKWYETTGMEGFPQAGLFISDDLYTTNPTKVDAFLNDIEMTLDYLVSDYTNAESYYQNFGDQSKQAEKLGLSYSDLTYTQKEGKNLIGYAKNEPDIKQYYEIMDLGEVDETLFIDGYFSK